MNNDIWGYSSWFKKGLHNLKHKATDSKWKKNDDGTVTLAFTVISQAPHAARQHGGTSSGDILVEELTGQPFGELDFRFVTNQLWTVYQDGSIELQSSITSNEPEFVLSRLGYAMTIPQRFADFTYYGRGPSNNYNDRKTSQFIQKYSSTVANQFVNFSKPQDMANREETRWCALTDQEIGLVCIATSEMAVSALGYEDLDLALAGHIHELPPAGDTVLHLDAKISGLGGASCGQGGPLEQDRAFAKPTDFGFMLRPARADLARVANVSPSGQVPIAITRTKDGAVRISSSRSDVALQYTVDEGIAQEYQEPIPLRGGGTVWAWYQGDKDSQIALTFPKMEKVDLSVVFASSEEPGGGNSAKNLVDGNPSTTWHSAYSVTVATYPHWVDFDAGEAKSIKGFTYQPRNDGGSNGDVKAYRIQTSLDGKKWSEPVQSGEFASDKKEKRVLFPQPLKVRFVRFTALSSQNGQDFASGAEFGLLTDSAD